MKLAVISKPNDGCDYYRCVLPTQYMPFEKEDEVKIFTIPGYVVEHPLVDIIPNIDAFEPDIIFFNRTIAYAKSFDWLEAQKKKGVKIVVDVDDYWELNPSHLMYNMWYKQKLNEQVSKSLMLADVVFATNEKLRKHVLALNKNCFIIPNAIPFGQPLFRQETPKNNVKMNFLYAAGVTHAPDVQILANKFDKLGGDPYVVKNAIFSLAGYNPSKADIHCPWDKMSSVFKRAKSYQILNTLPLEQHMRFYDSADVVLIPLVHNSFNECKSFLKVIEAASRELPCICSSVYPYLELKDFPIMWDNWVENIRYCIKNPNFVKDQGKELAIKVKEQYHLGIWSQVRYDIFKHLIKKA
jgi:hypothetical protein